MIDFLRGKKTYIVGVLTVVLGLLNNDMQMVMVGLLALTGRAAIAKSE